MIYHQDLGFASEVGPWSYKIIFEICKFYKTVKPDWICTSQHIPLCVALRVKILVRATQYIVCLLVLSQNANIPFNN